MDIGTDSIKMLQMHQADKTVAVSACGRWRFPDIPISDTKQRRELAV